MITLGEKIRKIRIENDLKQNELAELLYVSEKTISSWENNRTNPDLNMIYKISDYFKKSFYYLISDDYGTDNIKKKIDDLLALGYSLSQIIKMTSMMPSIYSYTIENMKQKISDLEALGYTKEEIISMSLSLPAIYSFTIENIKEKIDYLKEIGIVDVILLNPKNLMQSVDLIYARYRFLTEDVGLSIDYSNAKYLFKDRKHFFGQFHVGNEELLERYNYDLEVRCKNKVLNKG